MVANNPSTDRRHDSPPELERESAAWGVEPAMSAKPDQLPTADTLAETIDFFGNGKGMEPRRGPDVATPSPAPNPTEGRHRYTFGSGARPLEGYTIKRAIGRGGFGEVYYATSDSGKEVALKLITRNLEIERRGVAQCMNLKCQNLLAIHDIKGNDEGDTFVIMEYVAGPNLAQVLADYPEGMPLPEVRAWLRGLVEGVSYLHDHGIVHRDLKPANLFMEEGIVKIGDYGLSKMITSERVSNHSESIGTCHYMAPEISTGKYNKPIDIYAIGVILFEMLNGQVPFDGETVGEVLIKHLTTRPDLSAMPDPYREIVAKALAKDPAHRQSRVLDLLPPGDAPAVHDVRFIGDGRAAAPASAPRPAPRADAAANRPAPPPSDDILRITDEEPILYIGPDTRPPAFARPALLPEAVRRIRRLRDDNRRRIDKRRQQVARSFPVRLIATEPMVPEEPILPPPPLATGRVRVGELAGSLVTAALYAVPAALVGGATMQVDFASRPQDIGFLCGMILVASWAALIGGKFTEGQAIPAQSRRFAQLGVGLLLGVVAQLLAGWLWVDPAPAGQPLVQFRWADADLLPAWLPAVLAYAVYFGLVAFGIDWWTLTDRDRRRRFRVYPVFKAGVVAALPALIFFSPESHPLAIPVVVLTALVVQASAPWHEGAAQYARATRPARRWVA